MHGRDVMGGVGGLGQCSLVLSQRVSSTSSHTGRGTNYRPPTGSAPGGNVRRRKAFRLGARTVASWMFLLQIVSARCQLGWQHNGAVTEQKGQQRSACACA